MERIYKSYFTDVGASDSCQLLIQLTLPFSNKSAKFFINIVIFLLYHIFKFTSGATNLFVLKKIMNKHTFLVVQLLEEYIITMDSMRGIC
jgi:hypothetical protein